MKLGAKGFFTVIFVNLEDKERIFEEGPYFMNNAGLFMRHWEERYNPDAEKLLAAPVWVRLFGLPSEFWNPEILEGIGNSIGAFVKVAESTKRGKFTSYARICVYMNIAEPLPEFVEVEYHDEIWQQPLDYEHIPFRCRKCHEYGHLYRECPQNREGELKRIIEEEQRKTAITETEERGFKEVHRRQKPRTEGQKEQTKGKNIPVENQNKFQALQDEEEETEEGKQEEPVMETVLMEIIADTLGKPTAKRKKLKLKWVITRIKQKSNLNKGQTSRKRMEPKKSG